MVNTRGFYFVSKSDYDEYNPTLLAGPYMEWEKFKLLCNELLPVAADMALQDASSRTGWAGWNGIHESLIKLLTEKMGFEKVTYPEYNMFGSSIIDSEKDGEGLPPVLIEAFMAHNKKINDNLTGQNNYQPNPVQSELHCLPASLNCDLYVWCQNKGVDRFEVTYEGSKLLTFAFWFLCNDCAARLYRNGIIKVE